MKDKYFLEPIYKMISERYREIEYPLLKYQIETWRESKPFQGLKILDATPLFYNTCIKHLALIEAGASLTVGISDNIAYSNKAYHLLQEAGIPIVRNSDACGRTMQFDYVLDCAAEYSLWNARCGYAELTRSGVDKYKEAKKRLFVVDGGIIKRIETSFGTGESYFRAMSQLGYNDWHGKKIVIFGCGKVGSGILFYAHKWGANITVVTDVALLSDSVKQIPCRVVSFNDRTAISKAVRDADAVVTATGVRAAVENSCDLNSVMLSKALMANMGIEDEYGDSIPASRILQGKNTLNFILEEPTQLRYIETTMALHNEAVNYFLTHSNANGTILPPISLEEQLLSIVVSNGCISNEIQAIMSFNY